MDRNPCIGYLGHPFEKKVPWAFTARLFLVVKWVYWLLSTSVLDEGPSGFHRQLLSLCQVGLSHRSRRGIVLIHKRKQRCLDSKPPGKADNGSMSGLPKISSGMRLRAGWT
jgi:hypothetical protein